MDDEPVALSLRVWAEGDLELLQGLLGDPLMTEHIGGPETPEKIRARHARYCASTTLDGPMFAIVIGPEQDAIGSIGFWERQWRGETVWETGWSILPRFQGRGFATRAALLILDKARQAGTYRYLHAYPAVDNPPSNAICRKAGFHLLGPVDFEYPPGHWMRCNDWRWDLFASPIMR
jgi:RimJ/RimL family protein N-acetyltransferase